MGNFAENLNLGNRFRPPLDRRCDREADKYTRWLKEAIWIPR